MSWGAERDRYSGGVLGEARKVQPIGLRDNTQGSTKGQTKSIPPKMVDEGVDSDMKEEE